MILEGTATAEILGSALHDSDRESGLSSRGPLLTFKKRGFSHAGAVERGERLAHRHERPTKIGVSRSVYADASLSRSRA